MNKLPMQNWIGVWSLYMREVRRFIKVYSQTLVAPTITTLLFLAVFSLALDVGGREVNGISFIEFLAPGLIMMAVAQNAFANTSSSIVIAKVQGNIVDTLMPPFTANELVFGIAMGGTTRGLLVGLVVYLAMSIFVEMTIYNLFYVLIFAFSASLMLSLLGLIGGIWSEKFDHIAAVTNFIVTPLSFLSGTFYSIARLPEFGQTMAYINPFFYMIDGFRYGYIGFCDVNPIIGVSVISCINGVLWLVCWRMFKTGYRLKP